MNLGIGKSSSKIDTNTNEFVSVKEPSSTRIIIRVGVRWNTRDSVFVRVIVHSNGSNGRQSRRGRTSWRNMIIRRWYQQQSSSRNRATRDRNSQYIKGVRARLSEQK